LARGSGPVAGRAEPRALADFVASHRIACVMPARCDNAAGADPPVAADHGLRRGHSVMVGRGGVGRISAGRQEEISSDMMDLNEPNRFVPTGCGHAPFNPAKIVIAMAQG